MYPENLLYTKDHEWIRVEKDEAVVGITQHAQEMLGDIVFVDLPAVGKKIAVEGTLASVESVKAVSDVYSPISGEVTQVNEALSDHPELINSAPHTEGWIARVKLSDAGQLSQLMKKADYETYLAQEQKS